MRTLLVLLLCALSPPLLFAQGTCCPAGLGPNSINISRMLCDLQSKDYPNLQRLFDRRSATNLLLAYQNDWKESQDGLQTHRKEQKVFDKQGTCFRDLVAFTRKNLSEKFRGTAPPPPPPPNPDPDLVKALTRKIDSLHLELGDRDQTIQRLLSQDSSTISGQGAYVYRGRPVYEVDILFAFDRYQLSATARRQLDDLVIFHRTDCDHCEIALRGFTDATGSFDYNKNLSENRVLKVLLHLVNAGVDPTLISSTYFGELGDGPDDRRKVAIQVVDKNLSKARKKEIRP
ncbi:MAG: OmpA family protein [Bacteroidota bacterium]